MATGWAGRMPTGPAATLTPLDALGRVVRRATAPGGQDYSLALTSLVPGMYALRVRAGAAEPCAGWW
ncbi:MAG: hypothetical protein ACRYFX_07550 [Janthinobacterium lividum]